MYSLCVAYPEPLADRLYSETKSFLEAHVGGVRQEVEKAGTEGLLAAYHREWEKFSKGCDYLHMLFS